MKSLNVQISSAHVLLFWSPPLSIYQGRQTLLSLEVSVCNRLHTAHTNTYTRSRFDLVSSPLFLPDDFAVCDYPSPVELSLTREDLLHLHSTLIESLTFVILLLKKLTSSESDHSTTLTSLCAQGPSVMETQNSSNVKEPDILSPLLVACVRVIGAWLAEDSLSLSSEVHSCLPLLIQLAKSTDNAMAEIKGEDILKFILPGLSHLTAEDKPRSILLKAGVLELLFGHVQRVVDAGPLSL